MRILGVSKPASTFFRSPRLKQWVVLLAITMTVVYSIVYTSLQYFGSDNFGGNSDSVVYMQLARGEKVEAGASKSARVLTILLVRALPNPPAGLFAAGRVVDEEWRLKVRFALVNGAFLVGAALFFWYYMRLIGFSVPDSYLGMLLFLTSLNVVYAGAIPLVDASSFFFIAAGAVAIAARQPLLLAVVLVVGLFAKESVALLAPLALIAVTQDRLKWLAATLPGLAIYVVWRLLRIDLGGDDAGHLEPGYIRTVLDNLPGYLRANKVIDLVSSFNLLWVPAFYALFSRKLDRGTRRQYWWVALVLLVAVAFGTGLGRTLFLAFPVVIPSAVLGITSLWKTGSRPDAEKAAA